MGHWEQIGEENRKADGREPLWQRALVKLIGLALWAIVLVIALQTFA